MLFRSTMGRTGTHSHPLGMERNGMCDVMIRSRVVRSYPLGQACLVFKEIEAMKGAQWEKRAKMVEDRNICLPFPIFPDMTLSSFYLVAPCMFPLLS